MKKGSDNYRDSAVLDIILMIKKLDTSIRIIVYEPLSTNQQIIGCDLYSSSTNFLESSTLILANRMDDLLLPYKEKVFTRDVYGEN
jgi:UDPglucose 6-dehydrogenase